MTATANSLEARMARYRPLVQRELREILGSDPIGLFAWMRYQMGWEDEGGQAAESSRGKMLRPTALLLAAEAAGGAAEDVKAAAAAIELVHNFSLLHDDVEDASERRHDRPTLWTFAGTAQAINTGDGMYTVARLAMYRLLDAGLPAERVLAAMRELDVACLALVRGQYLDISFEQRSDVTREEYLEMAGGKTAAMFSVPFALGARLAGAGEDVVRGYRSFGHHIGLAFQAVDDILGIWGDPAVTGKPVGDDLRSRKMTYPVIAALESATDAAAELRRGYGRPPPDAPADADVEVRRLAFLVEQAGGRAVTEAMARDQHDAAMAALVEADVGEQVIATCAEYGRAVIGRDF